MCLLFRKFCSTLFCGFPPRTAGVNTGKSACVSAAHCGDQRDTAEAQHCQQRQLHDRCGVAGLGAAVGCGSKCLDSLDQSRCGSVDVVLGCILVSLDALSGSQSVLNSLVALVGGLKMGKRRL